MREGQRVIPDNLFPAFQSALISGNYNLLLGSGVSLDSCNGNGEPLRSAEQLRIDLCKLRNIKDGTTLSRIASLLSPAERHKELVGRFSNCKPGPSVTPLPFYLWRRLFTFNIDDVVENAYKGHTDSKQRLIPINFDETFEPTPDRIELQAIHLHGWVTKPDSGFVFSYTDYAKSMSTMNPWMHLLAEILPSEPFIIAGTSLNEVDIEYYLSHRSPTTPRRGHGPSLLIEPNPDDATVADCKRFGLTLVKMTFKQFLDWLKSAVPSPPTLAQLLIPDINSIIASSVDRSKLLRFFSDFRLIEAGERPRAKIPSSFYYGRSPTKIDLDEHVDIERLDNVKAKDIVSADLQSPDGPNLLIVYDDAGVGKSTLINRVAHDLSRQGQVVLSLQSLARFDPMNAAECFSSFTRKVVVLIDGLADHVDQVVELLQQPTAASRIVLLAAERQYRREYIDLLLGELPRASMQLRPFDANERSQLIEMLRGYGLVGTSEAIKSPREFQRKLQGDAVAVAVCRILNDFRPLDSIVSSVWDACEQEHRLPYLCAALSRHCHSSGIRYSILQSVAGLRKSVSDLFTTTVSLMLTDNPEDPDYAIPMNAIIGDRILQMAADKHPELLVASFSKLATALSPHVNRLSIMRRTPEARLAQRLFDSDKVTKPLLRERTQEWYVSCQPQWEWNSRYWEQRALLIADTDLDTAVRYARHAVAIELHPFTLTTLGKLLLRQMEFEHEQRDRHYREAFRCLAEAISREQNRSRISVHPYATLLAGTSKYLENGGELSHDDRVNVQQFSLNARHMFPTDRIIIQILLKLDSLLVN